MRNPDLTVGETEGVFRCLRYGPQSKRLVLSFLRLHESPNSSSRRRWRRLHAPIQGLAGERACPGATLREPRSNGALTRRAHGSSCLVAPCQKCFAQFEANEARLCGEWAVFYHSCARVPRAERRRPWCTLAREVLVCGTDL